MSTLKELAPEYRRAAAKLALWLEEQESAGTLSAVQMRSCQAALKGIREVQRLLDGYYDVPRPEGISAAGWVAGRYNDD